MIYIFWGLVGSLIGLLIGLIYIKINNKKTIKRLSKGMDLEYDPSKTIYKPADDLIDISMEEFKAIEERGFAHYKINRKGEVYDIATNEKMKEYMYNPPNRIVRLQYTYNHPDALEQYWVTKSVAKLIRETFGEDK